VGQEVADEGDGLVGRDGDEVGRADGGEALRLLACSQIDGGQGVEAAVGDEEQLAPRRDGDADGHGADREPAKDLPARGIHLRHRPRPILRDEHPAAVRPRDPRRLPAERDPPRDLRRGHVDQGQRRPRMVGDRQ